METNEKPGYERTIRQTMDVWVLPEILRRQAAGKLPTPVELSWVQVVFKSDGKNVVRINDEVRGTGGVRVKDPSKIKHQGGLIYDSDVKDILSINLVEDERDFGHITIFFHGDQAHLSFSAIYDASKSLKLVSISKEFLDSAEANLKADRLRTAVADLYFALENIAKARVMHFAEKAVQGKRGRTASHSIIKKTIRKYATSIQVFGEDFEKCYELLFDAMNKQNVRYNPKFSVKKDDLTQALVCLREYLAQVESVAKGVIEKK